jgi:hypothetical protein
MPQSIALQAIPNQSFSFNASNTTFGIILKATAGCMSASITINGTDVVDNARCVAWRGIIPAQYQENGNFMFMTKNLQLPWYAEFGTTQTLLYFSPNQLSSIRAANLGFSPFGGLPLRFQPVGYLGA